MEKEIKTLMFEKEELLEMTPSPLMIERKESEGDVAVIILLYKNPAFERTLKPYEIEIMGKKMWKWIELGAGEYPVKTCVITPETDIISAIKPILTEKKYTLVFYSDTPLITKTTIDEIVTYMRSRDCGAINLVRGYAFNTEYLKEIDSIQNDIVVKICKEDFLQAKDFKSIELITSIIKENILNFHLENGVHIQDKNSVIIEADVIIESAVTIEPFNEIKGKTYIGKQTTLEMGNRILDCIIGDNVILRNSYLKNCKIDNNKVIGPFEKIEN